MCQIPSPTFKYQEGFKVAFGPSAPVQLTHQKAMVFEISSESHQESKIISECSTWWRTIQQLDLQNAVVGTERLFTITKT